MRSIEDHTQQQHKTWLLTAFTAVLIFLPVTAYAGGYLYLGEIVLLVPMPSSEYRSPEEEKLGRVFEYDWQVFVFRPAGAVETFLRGREVVVRHRFD